MSLIGVGETQGSCREDNGCFQRLYGEILDVDRLSHRRTPDVKTYVSFGTGGGNFEEYFMRTMRQSGHHKIQLLCYEPYNKDDFSAFCARNYKDIMCFTEAAELGRYVHNQRNNPSRMTDVSLMGDYPTCVFSCNFQLAYTVSPEEFNQSVDFASQSNNMVDYDLFNDLGATTPFVWTSDSVTDVHVETVGQYLARFDRQEMHSYF